MQRFLDEILLLLPVLGVHDFDLLSIAPAVSPSAVDSASTNTGSKSDGNTTADLQLKLTEKKAYAEGRDGTQGFIVSKGAFGPASAGVMAPSYRNNRETLIDDGSLVLEGERAHLIRDTLFGSPSAAASVITGGSRNGKTSWRDDSGRTLDEIREVLTKGTVEL